MFHRHARVLVTSLRPAQKTATRPGLCIVPRRQLFDWLFKGKAEGTPDKQFVKSNVAQIQKELNTEDSDGNKPAIPSSPANNSFKRVFATKGSTLQIENSNLACTLLFVDKVVLRGNTFITGGMTAGDLEVHSDEGTYDASPRLGGFCTCENLTVNGTGEFTFGLNANDVNVKGRLLVGTGLKGRDVDVDGRVTVGKSIKAASLKVMMRGGNSKTERVSADKVQIELAPKESNRKTNGAKKSWSPWADTTLDFINANRSYFIADAITAKDVFLENGKVLTVKGESVEIKGNCDILTLEYTKSVKIDKQAIVRNVVKVDSID